MICPSLPRWPLKKGTAGPLSGDFHIWCDKGPPQDDDEVKENRCGRLSGCIGRPFSGPPCSPETGIRTSAWRHIAFCCSGALIVFVLAETWYSLGRMCWISLRLLRICLGQFWFLVHSAGMAKNLKGTPAPRFPEWWEVSLVRGLVFCESAVMRSRRIRVLRLGYDHQI